MIQILIAIVELFFILGAAWGISFLYLKKDPAPDPYASLIIRTSLGLGSMAYLTLIAAALHLIGLPFFILVMAIGNLLALKNLNRKTLCRMNARLSLLAVLLLLFILINFFFSLFPPTFYDSMLYHLAIPQYYISHGGITSWNSNFNSNLPLNGEMLFLYSLLGQTVHIPRLLSFFAGIAILVILYSWTKNHFSISPPLLPLIFFYTIPQIGFLTSSSKTDMLGLLFVLLAIFLFFLFQDDPRQKRLLFLSGVFWGFSLGTKYIFAFYLLGFFLALVFYKPLDFRKKIFTFLLISLLVFLCLVPWFIKNVVISGNPVYPYFNQIFKSEYWSPEQATSFSTGIKRGKDYRFYHYLYYPIEVFLKPYKYGITQVWGILVLLFLPLLFWVNKHPKAIFLIITALVSFFFLLLAAKVPRYFLSSLLLISIPLAFGSSRFLQKKIPVKKIFTLLLVILILINLIMQIDLQEKFTKGFTYLKKKLTGEFKATPFKYLYLLPYYRAVEYLNINLLPDDLVIFLGEDRTFYLQKKFLASSFNDHNYLIIALRASNTMDEFHWYLKKKGITHILFSEKGLQRMGDMSSVYRITETEYARLRHFLSQYPTLYQDNRYIIYKI
jgi:hypothetical protein